MPGAQRLNICLKFAFQRGICTHDEPDGLFWRELSMKVLMGVLLVVFALLQYRLWFGDASYLDVLENKQRIEDLSRIAAKLKARNEALEAEVKDLKNGLAAIEGRARRDLGMIKKDETFFQIIEPSSE